MTIRIHCPACDTEFSVADSMRGRKVRCKECDKMLAVPGGKAKSDPDMDVVEEKNRGKVKAKARFRDAKFDEQEGDSVDEAPVRKKTSPGKPEGTNPVVWIAAGGGLLLVVAVALIFVLRSGGTTKTPTPVAENKTPKEKEVPTDGNKPGDGKEPKKDPEPTKDADKKTDPNPKTPPEPEPFVPAVPLNGEKIYQKLLKSTVFIVAPVKATTGGGNKGGFPGGFPGANQGGFPGANQGGFPGANQGGFPGGFPGANQGGFPMPPGGANQGGFPIPPGGANQGGFPMPPGGANQGGFPMPPGGANQGGFPGGQPGKPPSGQPGGGLFPGAPGGDPKGNGGGLFPTPKNTLWPEAYPNLIPYQAPGGGQKPPGFQQPPGGIQGGQKPPIQQPPGGIQGGQKPPIQQPPGGIQGGQKPPIQQPPGGFGGQPGGIQGGQPGGFGGIQGGQPGGIQGGQPGGFGGIQGGQPGGIQGGQPGGFGGIQGGQPGGIQGGQPGGFGGIQGGQPGGIQGGQPGGFGGIQGGQPGGFGGQPGGAGGQPGGAGGQPGGAGGQPGGAGGQPGGAGGQPGGAGGQPGGAGGRPGGFGGQPGGFGGQPGGFGGQPGGFGGQPGGFGGQPGGFGGQPGGFGGQPGGFGGQPGGFGGQPGGFGGQPGGFAGQPGGMGGKSGGNQGGPEKIIGIATGSGSLIDRKHRLIITNVHVVGDNKTVTIYFPEFDDKGDLIIKKDEYKKKSGLTGTVVAREPRCDLALVQLDKLPPNVAPLPITKTKCLPAQQVHTVGNPGASKFLWIYSPGKIRQVGHDKWQVDDHEGKVYTYEGIKIETDSAINPGDSGGPLVNERGSLVGVVHAGNILAQNMSMFIEFSEVRALMETYYKSIGETWVPEPEPFVNEIPVAQITDWIKRLNHEDVNQRYKAAQTLGSMGPEGSHAFGALFKALKDSESIVRNAAADALEKVPPHKDDVGSLASALQDENEPLLVRQYAIKALVRLGGYGRPAMPALLAIALGNQESLRKESLLAAASIGPEGSDLPQLLKLVKGSNTDSRRKACTILAKMGEQAGPAVAELATLLKDKDQAVRLDVARALVGMGTAAKDAAKALVESLKDQDLEVAVQAARALIHLGDVKPGVALLSNNLKAPNLDLRKECVIGLGEAGPDAKAFAKDLVTLFEEDSLRPIAQESLLKIGKPALPSVVARLNVLMKNTGTSNPKARLACIHCLRDFDQATAEVGNALLLVGRLDPVAENRQAAEAAFRKLGGGTNPTTPGKGGPTAGAGN